MMTKYFYVMLLSITLLIIGCTHPRIVECQSCGKTHGVIGGLLPGQGSRCSCGGNVKVVKHLTYEEWDEAKERGYVEH